MDTLNEKIEYLKTLIKKLDSDDSQTNQTDRLEIIQSVKSKLDDITERIGHSLKIYQVIPNIKIAHAESYTTEIDHLISLISDLQISSVNIASSQANPKLLNWYDRILYNIVKKQIASLSKCPMPMPKHLSFEAFNAFVFNETQLYTAMLNKDIVTTSELIEMIRNLDMKKIDFMKDPFKSRVLHMLQLLSSDDQIGVLPPDVVPIFKRCACNIDFSEEEIEEIITAYDNMMQTVPQNESLDTSYHIPQNAKIHDKDVDVLITAMKYCPKQNMFGELCDILNIPTHVRDVLFKNILKTNQSQPANVEVPSQYRHLFIE